MATASHVPKLPKHLRGLSDDELLAHLEHIAEQLAEVHAEERKLLDERLAVFGKLQGRVTLVVMAEHAGLTSMGVRFALRPPATRRSRAQARAS